MADLTDKVCVVTGGCGGIGIAFADALLERGARVALLDLIFDVRAGAMMLKHEPLSLNSRGLEEPSNTPERVCFIQCDVTNESEFDAAIASAESQLGGPLYLLCNNAGIAAENFEKWKLMIDVNVTGVVIGTKLATQRMKNTGGGVIVNTASMAGLFSVDFCPVYAATKHAVVGLSRSLWAYRRQGIFVHAICPSFVDTPMAEQIGGQGMELMTPQFIAQGLLKLLDDGAERKSRCVLGITPQVGHMYVPAMRGDAFVTVPPSVQLPQAKL